MSANALVCTKLKLCYLVKGYTKNRIERAEFKFYCRPFHLTLSENHSSLTIYNGIDIDMYSSLQHIPTKSSSDYYTLEDVLANDQNLNGEHINILAAVRNVSTVKLR